MRHIAPIAWREIRAFFVSPVAYVVLTLFSVLAGSFFLSSLLGFAAEYEEATRLQSSAHLAQLNLDDGLIMPFFGAMWIVMLFLLPAVTMGLFASEKSNGTEELLLTSPVTGSAIVLGKFCAGGAFALLLVVIVAFFPGLLFVFGEPDLWRTAAGLLGLLLVALAYVAVGGFASALSRSQLIAFMVTLAILVVVGMLLPFIVDAGIAGGHGDGSQFAAALDWASTGRHMENLLAGLIDTSDLAYFAFVIAAFLVATKTAVESVRWR